MSLGLQNFFEPREVPFQRQQLYRLAYLPLMAVGYEKLLKIGAYDVVTLEDGATYLDIYIADVPKKDDPNTALGVSLEWQEFNRGLIKKFIEEHELVFTESPILENPRAKASPFIDPDFYGMRFLWNDVQNNNSVLATVEKLSADLNAAAFCLGWAEQGEEWDYVNYIQATLENFSFGVAGTDLSEALIDKIFADSESEPRKMIRTRRPWDDIDDCKEYIYTHMEIVAYSKITFVLKNRSSEKERIISVDWKDIPWRILTGSDPCPQVWQDNFSVLRKKQIFSNPCDYEKILEAISGTVEYKKGVGPVSYQRQKYSR